MQMKRSCSVVPTYARKQAADDEGGAGKRKTYKYIVFESNPCIFANTFQGKDEHGQDELGTDQALFDAILLVCVVVDRALDQHCSQLDRSRGNHQGPEHQEDIRRAEALAVLDHSQHECKDESNNLNESGHSLHSDVCFLAQEERLDIRDRCYRDH